MSTGGNISGLRWMGWIGGEYDYSIFGGVDHGMMDISWFLGSVEEAGVGENNSLIDTCTKIFVRGFWEYCIENYAIILSRKIK